MSKEVKTIEVKTAELEGAALDWAVGIAEGHPMETPASDMVWSKYHGAYCPSIDWAQGGPLIEFYRICFAEYPNSCLACIAHNDHGGPAMMGETRLIAACRAIVASKMGDVVQVPADLMGGRSMSKEVKRYTLFASLRPEAIAFLPDEVVSAHDYDALLAERDSLKSELAGLLHVVGMSVDGSAARNKAMLKAHAALQGEQK